MYDIIIPSPLHPSLMEKVWDRCASVAWLEVIDLLTLHYTHCLHSTLDTPVWPEEKIGNRKSRNFSFGIFKLFKLNAMNNRNT